MFSYWQMECNNVCSFFEQTKALSTHGPISIIMQFFMDVIIEKVVKNYAIVAFNIDWMFWEQWENYWTFGSY